MTIRDAARIAVQLAFVSVASYTCGVYLTGLFHDESAGVGGLWAVMSGNVVFQETRRKTWSAAWLQLVGTLVGSIVGTAYLSSLPFSAAGMAATIVVSVLICHLARIPDHARVAALSVGVVMVFSSLHPSLHPALNFALRFSEACVGTAMAALVVLLWPEPKVPR